MDLGSVALGGAFNVLTGVGSGIAGAISAKKNREWNERMWNMQNAYNTPAAQMQRLKDAGLNPNLIYGQMSSSNAGPVGSSDVYNSKGWSEAIGKIDLANSAVQLAKARQELKAMKIQNEFSSERLDEFKNQRVAEEHYSIYNSDYGKQMIEKGYTYQFNPDGSGGYWIKDGDISKSIIKYKTFGYLLSKLMSDLSKINTGSSLNIKKGILTDTLNELRLLDKDYLHIRNTWLPWEKGVNMGLDILGGFGNFLFPALNLRLKSNKPAPVYNTNNYRSTYYYR